VALSCTELMKKALWFPGAFRISGSLGPCRATRWLRLTVASALWDTGLRWVLESTANRPVAGEDDSYEATIRRSLLCQVRLRDWKKDWPVTGW
jgi:hypothetical protein